MAASIVSPTEQFQPVPNPSTASMKRAALYARVSTPNGQNPEMQLRELREYCDRRGWQVFSEYVDAGITSFQCVLASVHQQEQMDRIATEVIPALMDL